MTSHDMIWYDMVSRPYSVGNQSEFWGTSVLQVTLTVKCFKICVGPRNGRGTVD